MEKNTNYIGNLSTVVKYLSMCLAGVIIGTLANHGLHLPVDEQGFSEVIGAIIFLILAHIDATHPNTFFESEIDDKETLDEDQIEDIDPAGEYEDE